MILLTKQEQKVYNLLAQKSGMVVTRDDIAKAIWGETWLKKYSDWRIDRLIYTLRNKLTDGDTIKTARNIGYVLVRTGVEIDAESDVKAPGTLPSNSYLRYMNDPNNQRQVYKNLFAALAPHPKGSTILAINSYSFDNIDTLAKIYPKAKVYFTNFDTRAIKIHADRIHALKLPDFHSTFDDIRQSAFKDGMFDLVINDFRLNFNTDNSQNKMAISNIYRVLKVGGVALISVVIDPRYESPKFGKNQEKAPTNKDKPWDFAAQEGLRRKCFTVPYYRRIFTESGFSNITEFDTENGKKWNPPFRRFILTK